MEYGWENWTSLGPSFYLFLSFGKFMSSALIVSAAKGNTPLEIYVSSSNLLIFLLIVSPCGFFFFFASLCLRRSGGIPWDPFFSFVLSCSFPFNCKSYTSLSVLASLCLQR